MEPETDAKDLVAAYFEYFRSDFDASLFWAWGALHGEFWDRPADWLDLVFALLDGAPDDYCVELVGADALEGILWRAGDAVIGAIEAEATSNPRLRRALWIVDGLHDQPLIEARVRRILKDEPRPEIAQRPTDWPQLPDER